MDELNDYVFLSKEDINKMISVWVSDRLVYENLEFECLSAAKKFTISIIGTKPSQDKDLDDKMEYVVQEREFDPESKRFMYQYFLAESVGRSGPIILTKKILLRPFTSMLIDETSRLMGQWHIVRLQLDHNETLGNYNGVPKLYVAACTDTDYNKELFTKVANEYAAVIHKFRNLVYDAVMQYDGVK